MFFRVTPGGDEALNFAGSNAGMIGTNVRFRSWKSQRKNIKILLLEKSISKKLEKEKIIGQKWPKNKGINLVLAHGQNQWSKNHGRRPRRVDDRK
jgi:hypothetical protein